MKKVNTLRTIYSMEHETKKCPYCGEVILAEAKKCKHCGEWLDRDVTPRNNDSEQAPSVSESEEEPDGEIGCLILFEGFIILGVLTFIYDWSLWVTFVASAVIYSLMLFSRVIRVIISVVFSALWGLISTLLCPWIFSESELKMAERLINNDYADYWYVGIAVFLVALLFHWDSMKKIF